MKVAYFGDKNSHTFAATFDFKEKGIIGADFESVSKQSITECFKAVASEQCEYAVVPLENSVEGGVNETLDSFLDNPVYILSETVKVVNQNLIAFKNAKKEDIKVIYSHPQALSQCRRFLESNFPHVDKIAAKSTSDGINKITSNHIAAIGRGGLNDNTSVLLENIQDYRDNSTKFILLGSRPVFTGKKCSIIFDTQNAPGALLQVLQVLKEEKINMTKIESRPTKTTMGRYMFFADFIFEKDKDELNKLLGKLSTETGFIKFLGLY